MNACRCACGTVASSGQWRGARHTFTSKSHGNDSEPPCAVPCRCRTASVVIASTASGSTCHAVTVTVRPSARPTTASSSAGRIEARPSASIGSTLIRTPSSTRRTRVQCRVSFVNAFVFFGPLDGPGRPPADIARVGNVSAPASGPDPSRLRIGDTERNSAMDALSEHLGKGRIDLDEFGTRSAQITQARTVAELRALFADLPPPHPTLPGPAAPAIRPATPAVPRGASPERPNDTRTPAQRGAAVLLAASGIISLLLFFVLKTWLVFLIPALIAVATSALWGSDWRRRY